MKKKLSPSQMEARRGRDCISRLGLVGGAVEVFLNLRPEVVGDVAAHFESFNVVGLDVVAAEDSGDACELGDFGEGWELEGDVAAGVCVSSDHFCEGFTVKSLHFLTAESLFGNFASFTGLDEAAVV